MHKLILLVCTAGSCLLGLSVLQHLQNLRLQQSEPEIMISHNLICGLCLVCWWLQESLLGNVSVIKQRRKLGGDDLIGNTLPNCQLSDIRLHEGHREIHVKSSLSNNSRAETLADEAC